MSDCIFCKIVRGEIPSHVVYKDEWVTAFRDINPQAPIHILIVPNQHLDGLLDVTDAHMPIMGRVLLAANAIAKKEEFAHNGFRLVANEGHDANQTVEHLHFHVLAGRRMGWPPG
jgi:histidine triad (HIT) family protein